MWNRWQKSAVILSAASVGFLASPLWSEQSNPNQMRPLIYYNQPMKNPQEAPVEDALAPVPVKKSPCVLPLFEVRAGYFIFTDHKMRKVFDQGGLDLQAALSLPIYKWLQLYMAGERVEKKGRSTRIHRRTHFWEYMGSLGLKGTACMSSWAQWYLTIGPRYFYVHVHNNSPYVDRKVNHSGVGGFAGTGFNFFPAKNFFIDIFGEYSYGRLHFHAHKKHVYGEDRMVGGFAVGGGLGFAF